ncbi:hypothetical protein SAMN05444166_3477 [Singulisphaera sp. GP187]|uniref:hypothetical protein n=1 Tax=Singulisphaera sp. GP187 TaxID=1882752 RepID=UPI00092A31E9|nr:hypothetical protein [Singulisphaera sp. GP187]SIO28361.1 hypothetical protein SAMN05444166_3477 [Singulisphaera sp. GP187]
MRISRRLSRISGGALLALLGGCGGGGSDDLPRQAISGTVTLDDRPLPHGFIQFQPVGAAGVATGGTVADGKYAIDRLQGPTPGDYKVLISSSSAPEAAAAEPLPPPGAPTPPKSDPIPAKYNSASTLTAKIEASNATPLDFSLKSK